VINLPTQIPQIPGKKHEYLYYSKNFWDWVCVVEGSSGLSRRSVGFRALEGGEEGGLGVREK
jgi:hypothetical protein